MEDHSPLNPHPYDYEPVRLIVEPKDVSGKVQESVHQILHIL